MGICASKQTKEVSAKTKTIDVALKKDHKVGLESIKLLLLGAGESGKSTIFKQVRFMHRGFTPAEMDGYKTIIRENIYENIRILLQACDEFNVQLDPEMEESAVLVMNHLENHGTGLPLEIASLIEQLWYSQAIQKVYENRNLLQLYDSANYFFEDLVRVASPDYQPTQEDILRVRIRTTGITNVEFELENVKFALYDVGGQRNERRKWYHCFDNVHAVLFVAAISEFDQVLFEDKTVNRLVESLNLFSEIANSRFFRDSAIILFLNKRDLFAEKIKKGNLSSYLPDYKGTTDFNEASNFIQNKFAEMVPPEHSLYIHVTCATDQSNIRFTLNAIKDVMFDRTLKASGFM